LYPDAKSMETNITENAYTIRW